MTALPFSDKQRAALLALRHGRKTTHELAAAIAVGRGIRWLLQALYSRGLIKYSGGKGVSPGKGWWALTTLGASTVLSLASPFGEGGAP